MHSETKQSLSEVKRLVHQSGFMVNVVQEAQLYQED